MAETGSQIFDLDALADIADDDVLVEVDVSDTTDSADGTNKKITIRDLLNKLNEGWIPAEQTWEYLSTTTIKVPTGAEDIYQEGQRFKLTANSVILQGYIVGVADTVLTVAGDALTNHTFTENYYSTTENPLGFPQWFSFSGVTFSCATSGTITFTSSYSFFCIHGKEVVIEGIYTYSSGSSPVGELTVDKSSLPVPISSLYESEKRIPLGLFAFIDIGAVNDSLGFIRSQEDDGQMYMPISGINEGYLLSSNIGSSDYVTISLHYRMA